MSIFTKAAPPAATRAPRGASDPKPSAEGGAAPRTWWQWMLLYPGLLLGLLGSLPTVKELVQSNRVGVPFGESAAAQQQQDLWAKNMSCYEAPFDGMRNEFNVQVDATICRSGDVLVRFLGPLDRKSYRWVPVERFETKVGTGFSFMGTAVAATLHATAGESVVCQWSPAPGFVVRRLQNPQNQCFEEKIRTATGEVVGRNAVACNTPCGH